MLDIALISIRVVSRFMFCSLEGGSGSGENSSIWIGFFVEGDELSDIIIASIVVCIIDILY